MVRPAAQLFSRRLLSEDKLLVPAEPEISKVEEPCSISVPEFDSKKILLLESLSLARFDDEQAVALLRAVVRKAKQLQDVHVEGVAKMFTVWNNQDCPLADDVPTEQSPPEKVILVRSFMSLQVLSNAARVLDQYFVSPPGNIALGEASPLDIDLINEWDRIGARQAPKPKSAKFG
ncbi:unnamed protein product [Heligmosomoides polygyrus]|uniref:Glutamyl-tRNA(Gln) amidotransferase subunit C, mitochondrial n=1 Tax=Heligmosomoides polygyrus TaxID=6339 RepID=A0A183G6G8_HELPZ|nr:unnamed protein product [Heligmosomoides polygyrus]